jgi:deoxycytidine triphosphate deaminase
MTVKSDNWISRMAREYGMIVPFEERLLREVEGRRIISAGLSSYGYDIRLARDGFYIFSPIKGREIDPKNFDNDSLIEAPLRTAEDGSHYWLLPPLSYALGVTVETFNIPRRIIGLCFGKCLTGDTRVLDARKGRWVDLRTFVEQEMSHTATLTPQGVVAGRVTAHRRTGIEPVFELTTAAGRSIRATAGHRFLTPRGWRELRSLRPGDRIARTRCVPTFAAARWDGQVQETCPLSPRLDIEAQFMRSTNEAGLRPVVRIGFEDLTIPLVSQPIGWIPRPQKGQLPYATHALPVSRLSLFPLADLIANSSLDWDAIRSIRPAGREPVYDLTVAGTHNFIANDLVVHNSTYARSGVIVNATPLEPTWRGRLVLEISNSADLPVRIYAEEGIAQVVFFESDEECLTAYEDRQGKYQDQKGLVTPRV